jgi:hypothetical protein
MKAFFVGGITDNSELDLDGPQPPARYPPEHTGSGVHRYRLHSTFERDGHALFAVYAPPEMDDAEVARIVAERRYPQRFEHGTRPG